MPQPPDPIRPASPTCSQFFCDHCDAPTLLDDLHQAVLPGPSGSVVVDLCPACYRDGMDDGILESLRPT
jgi:hypothetical protein